MQSAAIGSGKIVSDIGRNSCLETYPFQVGTRAWIFAQIQSLQARVVFLWNVYEDQTQCMLWKQPYQSFRDCNESLYIKFIFAQVEYFERPISLQYLGYVGNASLVYV